MFLIFIWFFLNIIAFHSFVSIVHIVLNELQYFHPGKFFRFLFSSSFHWFLVYFVHILHFFFWFTRYGSFNFIIHRWMFDISPIFILGTYVCACVFCALLYNTRYNDFSIPCIFTFTFAFTFSFVSSFYFLLLDIIQIVLRSSWVRFWLNTKQLAHVNGIYVLKFRLETFSMFRVEKSHRK